MTAPPDAGPAVLGLVHTGGLDLALPLSALREVVPCPDRLTDVPVRAAGLLGVMSLRSTVVPVVDVLHVLGREHERRPDQVVVVVAHDGRLLGLLVDAVRGLATVAADALVRLRCADPGLLAGTFHHPEQGHVVSLVDPDALLALPGLPLAEDAGGGPQAAALAARRTAAGEASRAAAHSLTLVRCGAYVLALDVAFVHSTIPAPVLRPSPADGGACLGLTSVAGMDVGVVDPLALLGLGDLQGARLDCGLVLDLPDGQVVLGVSAMVGLHDVPADRVVPLPAAASPAPDWVTRVADVPGVGASLLLDGERLLAQPLLVALSRVVTPSVVGGGTDGAPTATAGGPARLGPPHLSYRAGLELATELGQVAEVLGYPTDLVRTSAAPEVLGFVLHRDAVVPVLALAEVLGRPAETCTASSRLLLLHVDGEPVAYAVSALHAILTLAWTDPEQPPSAAPSDVVRSCPLVQLDTSSALVPALDLVALTRRLRGTAPAVPQQRSGEPSLASTG